MLIVSKPEPTETTAKDSPLKGGGESHRPSDRSRTRRLRRAGAFCRRLSSPSCGSMIRRISPRSGSARPLRIAHPSEESRRTHEGSNVPTYGSWRSRRTSGESSTLAWLPDPPRWSVVYPRSHCSNGQDPSRLPSAKRMVIEEERRPGRTVQVKSAGRSVPGYRAPESETRISWPLCVRLTRGEPQNFALSIRHRSSPRTENATHPFPCRTSARPMAALLTDFMTGVANTAALPATPSHVLRERWAFPAIPSTVVRAPPLTGRSKLRRRV